MRSFSSSWGCNSVDTPCRRRARTRAFDGGAAIFDWTPGGKVTEGWGSGSSMDAYLGVIPRLAIIKA
jgi:hypothetical protein